MFDEYTPGASRTQSNQTNALIQAARRARRRFGGGQYRFGLRSLAEIEEKPWSAEQEKIRAIGKRLFAEGGRALMLEVWWKVFSEDMRDAKQIEIAWEGIGGWYR